MQKVSKQSLAMLALSILLAISIALTFTFAAVSNTRNANGTISFAGQSALLINNAEADYTFSISFNGAGVPTASGDNWDTAAVSLAASSSTSNVSAVLTIEVADDDGTLKALLEKYITAAETMVWNGVVAGGEVVKVKDTIQLATINPATNAADLAALSSSNKTMTVKIAFTGTAVKA